VGLNLANSIKIIKIYKDSFRANIYTREPFRMIGLIDASIKYTYGIERVTLAFYRSSGTNSGKTEGLWYPIVGIKLRSGEFTEFTKALNCILTNTTKMGRANKGWLAKSLFFNKTPDASIIRGFSTGAHYERLLKIGKILRYMYENNKYQEMRTLDASYLNQTLLLNEIIYHNNRTQRENFERFMDDIYKERYKTN
jgi:hypothetical protein